MAKTDETTAVKWDGIRELEDGEDIDLRDEPTAEIDETTGMPA